MNKDELADNIANFFVNSNDFNGMPLSDIDLDFEVAKQLLKQLIEDEIIVINFGDRHPNPHILAFEPESKDAQVKKLDGLVFEEPTYEQFGEMKVRFTSISACAYPTKKHLKSIIDASKHLDSPFTRKLAFGDPQLIYFSFDLSILETYRNDPRYVFDCDDISGSISIKSEYYESDKMYERDQVFLQTFGFSYDDDMNRAVSVFLRYLSDLSPEHQQIWNAKLAKGHYRLHPDYYRSSFLGDFYEKVSIFDAFIEEISQINKMCELMGRPQLFKDDYKKTKPREFSFLIRPTLKEYNDFIHLLDKMISENISKEFFMEEIDYKREITNADGKVIIENKGTIQLLDEWLNRIRFPDPEPRRTMINTFKETRKARMSPAHNINENVFDQQYFKDQRKAIIDAYSAIRTLRLIFTNHPRVDGYTVPEWLFNGEIWSY